ARHPCPRPSPNRGRRQRGRPVHRRRGGRGGGQQGWLAWATGGASADREKPPLPARADRSRRALSFHLSSVWSDPPMTFRHVGLRRRVRAKLHQKRVGLFDSVSRSFVSYRRRVRRTPSNDK